MVDYKYCIKCNCEIMSDDNSLCYECISNHNFSVFLKKLINSMGNRLFFNDDDFLSCGVDKSDINMYIWRLNEFNLISFNEGKFFIKLDEIQMFIDKNYVESYEGTLERGSDNLIEVYDPKTFELNKEGKNYKVDILKIVRNIKFVEENPKVPFPQSDDLNRFIFLSQHLLKNDMSKNEIKQLNQVHERIVNMYTSTGLYFGVFEKYHKNKEIFYKLSDKGKSIFQLEEFDRNLRICQCILEHEIFHRIFLVCFFKKRINKHDIVEIMLQYDLNMDSMVTIKRRASCVSSWMHWIFRLMDIDI